MAIAGSTKEAFFCRLENGNLRIIGSHRPASHLIIEDVDEAVEKLRRGEGIYYLKYADNLARLKSALEVQP